MLEISFYTNYSCEFVKEAVKSYIRLYGSDALCTTDMLHKDISFGQIKSLNGLSFYTSFNLGVANKVKLTYLEEKNKLGITYTSSSSNMEHYETLDIDNSIRMIAKFSSSLEIAKQLYCGLIHLLMERKGYVSIENIIAELDRKYGSIKTIDFRGNDLTNDVIKAEIKYVNDTLSNPNSEECFYGIMVSMTSPTIPYGLLHKYVDDLLVIEVKKMVWRGGFVACRDIILDNKIDLSKLL